MTLRPVLGTDLRALLVGTTGRVRTPHGPHYYDGPGNHFWMLLHASGLTPHRLEPLDDTTLPQYGLGLADLVWHDEAWDVSGLHRLVRRSRPLVVAFVSKTAAAAYARATGNRQPKGYGQLSWAVAGRAAFVLPGPSGANNGMSVPLRVALWRDLADYLETF